MKKITLILLVLLPFIVKATNYTSTANGNWSNSATWSPSGVPGSGDNVTIANTVTLNANESVNSITINSSETLTVSGSSTLNVYGNFTSNGTFTCSTGTVTFSGTGAQTLGGSASTFYNLTMDGATVTLGSNETVNNNLTITTGTLDVSASNYNLTIGGNFTNNATFTQRSGTVTFNGSILQTISGSSSITFYNLTINCTDTVRLGKVFTVNNNLSLSTGVLDCEQYQITGNATGMETISAGTTAIFGSTTSSTDVQGPTGYGAHLSLSTLSTVVFQANTASQTIAAGGTWGNIVISGGSSAITKTPGAGTTLTIVGTLTVNVVTLSMTTKNLSVGGNLTINGALSFGTGTLDAAANFTNNGTYTCGTGTANFNGSVNQTISGTNATTFYTLLENQASTTDTLFTALPTSSNTVTISQGVLDCQKHQLTSSSTPAVSLSPSSVTICYGSSTSLTASSYSTYIWSPSSSLSASTGATVTASPFATTTYTVYGSSSGKYTCGVGTDVITTNSCGPGDSASTAITITSLDTVPFSMSGKRNMWFKFVADSTVNLIQLFQPTALDTNIASVNALALFADVGGSPIYQCSDTVRNGISLDSLPSVETFTATIGNTYFIEVTRYQSSGVYINPFFRGLHRPTGSCSGGTCGHNLIINGDFEDSVSNTWGYNPYYLSGSISSGMRTTVSVGGTAANIQGIVSDYTDEYAIARADSNTVLIPSSWDLQYNAYDHTVNRYDKGHYFSGDAPSDSDPTVHALNPSKYFSHRFDVLAWQQAGIKIVPGATYNFSYWIKFASEITYTTGAAEIDAFVNAPAPTAAFILPAATPIGIDYANTNWKQVCYSWTANDTNTVATPQIYDIGNPSSSPFDFGIDDITFYLSSYAPITVVASNGTTICAEAPTTLTASPTAASYVWSPVAGLSATTGSTVVATPTVTTTYTVKYLSADSVTCTNDSTLVTITVNGNCCGTNCTATINGTPHVGGFSIPNGLPSTGLGSSPLTLSSSCAKSSSGTSWSIEGLFTVKSSRCSFDSCNIALAKYAQIVVDSLDTLYINNSRLYACDTMWQGIYVKPGGTLIVDSTSIIEDAQIGIEAKNGVIKPAYITVVNSLLNNNDIDLQVDPYYLSALYPVTLRNVTLTTSSDAFSGIPYIKPPYSIGGYGICLDTVTGNAFGTEAITIGDHNNTSYRNHFSNMNFGVYALNSNFAVFNNTFKNLEGYTTGHPINPIGVAVYAKATDYDTTNVNTYFTAIVGSSGANYNDSIINTCRGVDITDYVRLQVDSNFFYTSNDNYNAHGDLPYGDHAVYFKTEGHDSIRFAIDKNIIENYNTGIHVLGTLPTELMEQAYYTYVRPVSYINSNYIHVSSSNIFATGIQVENLYEGSAPVAYHSLMIQNNTIDSAQYCIYLNELYNSYTFVDDNPDLHVMPSISTNGTLKAGIYITDCYLGLAISGNTKIHADHTYIGTAAAADTDVVGIYDYISQGINICGNYMYDLGQDMKFQGDCSNMSGIISNSMDTAYDGLVLDVTGYINQQGDANDPSGNTWGVYTNFVNGQTSTYSSTGLSSPLYLIAATKPTLNYTNGAYGTNDYGTFGALKNATGTNLTCSSIEDPSVQDPSTLHKAITTTSIDTIAMIAQMRLVIHDSLPPVYTAASIYMMQQTIYEELNGNPSLLAEDSALQNFYTHTKNNNMGAISAIRKQIQNGNYVLAANLNNSILPHNTIEQNYRDLNSIILNTFAQGIDSGSSIQITALQNIATQCPMTGGRAVFEARAFLNGLLNTSILYTDNCSGTEPSDKAITPNQSQNYSAKVYPNPANSELDIEAKLGKNETGSFCLYSAVGQRVECMDIVNGLTTLSTANLPAGLYYYRITSNSGTLIKADKVMVIH